MSQELELNELLVIRRNKLDELRGTRGGSIWSASCEERIMPKRFLTHIRINPKNELDAE